MRWLWFSTMERLKRAFYNLFFVSSMTAFLASCAIAAVDQLSTAVSTTSLRISKLEIEIPKDPVTQGGVFFVSVRIAASGSIKNVQGLFQDKVIDFYPDGKQYTALVGVEYDATPGKAPMSLKAKLMNGSLVEAKIDILVKTGVFPSEKLRVPPRTVTPSRKDQKKIARDRVILRRVYATKTSSKLWDPPAALPVSVSKELTSVFGTSRVYNGKKQNVHLGADLRAPMGTPISVPISGKVAVSRYLFFTGYTVILDHGFGFFTIYGHLSKLKVKEGQIVKKGQIMGLSGATGRASGPHLHWGVNLHGTKVDPMVLVQALK